MFTIRVLFVFSLTSDDAKQKKKSYKFDKVFDPDTGQNDIFEGLKIPQLVSRVVDGYHATIFAYGQTGSGKTFTMEGYDYKSKNDGRAKSKAPVIRDNENIGITQRAVRDLFQQIKHKKEKHGKHIT
jgi:predicted ATPase